MINYNKIAEEIKKNKFNQSLKIIQASVERILYNNKYTAKKFIDKRLDNYCLKIGKSNTFKRKSNTFKKRHKIKKINNLILVSRLDVVGGGSKVIYDLINTLKKKTIVISTGLFPSKKINNKNIIFIETPEKTLINKVYWIQEKIDLLNPKNIWLFNSHQDSVAIAVFGKKFNSTINFIHHCDHNLSLGATINKFKHYDPHIPGYKNCRQLKMKNYYFPLVCKDYGKLNKIFDAKNITTATIASYNKFLIPYKFHYADLITYLLKNYTKIHYHVGRLTVLQLMLIYTNLILNRVSIKKFKYFNKIHNAWSFMKKNNIDFMISSFPLSGYRAIIETMGCGIPTIVHRNLISNIISGANILPKNNFIWNNYDEVINFFKSINNEKYQILSSMARKRYKKYHKILYLKKFLNRQSIIMPEYTNAYKLTYKNKFYKYRTIINLEIIIINIFRKLRQFFLKKRFIYTFS
jgi:hypothetical protein